MSFEAEKAVLGSMILDSECIPVVCETLQVDMLPDMAHRTIFKAIVKLYDDGTAIDFLTLRDELTRAGNLQQANGVDYIVHVAECVPSAASAEYYAKIVLESYKVIQLKALAQDITRITADTIEPDEMIAKVQKSVTEHTAHEDLKVIDKIGDIAANLSFECNGSRRIPTGFKAIDDIIIGIGKADFVIIAGRPSMGKTSLLLDIAVNMSWHNGFPVGFYSCEMLPEQLAGRMASARSEVSLYRVEKGHASKEEKNLIYEAARQMKDVPLYVKATSGLTPGALKRKILSDKRKYGIKVAFVDYLQLMQPDGKIGKEYENITNISRAIKPIILQTGVSVIMASQLRRTEHAKRPTMTDFRGSGAIEEDAEIIIGLHRPSYYTPEDPDNEAEAIILKGKHFGTGVAKLEFEGKLTHFRDKLWT